MSESVLPDILQHSPVRVALGSGSLQRLPELLSTVGTAPPRQVLLVTDAGIRDAGHLGRCDALLSGVARVRVFDQVIENPTTETVAAGVAFARSEPPDLVIGLGGGSVMDAAKGINLLLVCGGAVRDYWGDPAIEELTRRPRLLPMILIPTTAGTGSEAQSFALISDAQTHVKMACGDRRLPQDGGLRPMWALLDAALTRTQPRRVAAAVGIDALSHAVETSACLRRTARSRQFSRQAWDLLDAALETALRDPADDAARERMLLGAHLAGCAIEQAMLGAAHACANPLTARFGITHGVAVGAMLPHVVRFNAADASSLPESHRQGAHPYADLMSDAEALIARLHRLLDAAELPSRLRDLRVPQEMLPELAAHAARQWTAGFNPRPVDAHALQHIYQAAW